MIVPKPTHVLPVESSSAKSSPVAAVRLAAGAAPAAAPVAAVTTDAAALAASGAALESVPRRTRRTFSASEKLRIVKEAAEALSGKRGSLGALLRKEGINSSHLAAWRQQLGAQGALGLEPKRRGRKPKRNETDREVAILTQRNAVLERKLAVANALIELQKKAHAVLGLILPESDESEEERS